MLVLDHPEAIDDLALLVIGHLLEIQMGAVVGLQPEIAKVLAVEGAPWRHALEEWLPALVIASSPRNYVNRGTGIHIRLRQ